MQSGCRSMADWNLPFVGLGMTGKNLKHANQSAGR
jgi:hypothetical protein